MGNILLIPLILKREPKKKFTILEFNPNTFNGELNQPKSRNSFKNCVLCFGWVLIMSTLLDPNNLDENSSLNRNIEDKSTHHLPTNLSLSSQDRNLASSAPLIALPTSPCISPPLLTQLPNSERQLSHHKQLKEKEDQLRLQLDERREARKRKAAERRLYTKDIGNHFQSRERSLESLSSVRGSTFSADLLADSSTYINSSKTYQTSSSMGSLLTNSLTSSKNNKFSMNELQRDASQETSHLLNSSSEINNLRDTSGGQNKFLEEKTQKIKDDREEEERLRKVYV